MIIASPYVLTLFAINKLFVFFLHRIVVVGAYITPFFRLPISDICGQCLRPLLRRWLRCWCNGTHQFSLLLGTDIVHWLLSWELPYPIQRHFWVDEFPFPVVGYVSSWRVLNVTIFLRGSSNAVYVKFLMDVQDKHRALFALVINIRASVCVFDQE